MGNKVAFEIDGAGYYMAVDTFNHLTSQLSGFEIVHIRAIYNKNFMDPGGGAVFVGVSLVVLSRLFFL